VRRFSELLGIEPRLVAHDLHPDLLSTAEALAAEAERTVAVQHHHAHLAACLAEHGLRGPAVGAILDGAGYGPDGTVWGGEILVGSLADSERAGSLLSVAMPGGDAAAREPWRMACSWLAAAFDDPKPPVPVAVARSVSREDWDRVAALAAAGIASPRTSSAGRLFDAVAALCGVRARSGYEGQAAAELEWVADRGEAGALPFGVHEGPGGRLALDPRPAIREIVAALGSGTPVALIAARFHNALAVAVADACAAVAGARRLDRVCLAGGAFQNALLLARTSAELERRGLTPVIPRALPPNDAAISFGQVAAARARVRLA
jgi:hydrogenase maturation protein HypF